MKNSQFIIRDARQSLGRLCFFFEGLARAVSVFSRSFFLSVSFFFSRFGLGYFSRSVFGCFSRFFRDFFSDSFYRKVFSFLLVYSLVFSQAVYARNSVNPRLLNGGRLPIEVDGSTNTSVDRAANGVDVVNIAAPNSKGLSHNKFRNYNVNRDGLILNNSKGNRDGIVNSKLGGIILGNSHLVNSESARVILNEVTSTNKSYLRGYTEIVGGRADLIVANPNGVEVNGGGFINVDKVSLVVGSVNGLGGGVLGRDNLRFNLDVRDRVRDGFLPGLTILGSGLDVEDVGEVDLVSSVIEIMAPIYGGDKTDLSLRSGDDEFDYLTKAISSVVGGGGIGVGGVDSQNSGGSELLAIDASNLAKVQSGRIYVVATRDGFGVNFSNELLATKRGVEIDVNGDVSYRNISSVLGDIRVKAGGDIKVNGITETQTSDSQQNQSDITLSSQGNISLDQDAILISDNNIKLESQNDIINNGQIVSKNNIDIKSVNDFVNNSQEVNLADNDFIINAKNFTNLGIISANNDLDIQIIDNISNSKELIAGGDLEISALYLVNDDSIISQNNLIVNISESLTNNKDILSLSSIDSHKLEINSKNLNNNDRIASNNNIIINSELLANGGNILSSNNVELSVLSLGNDSSIIESGNNLIIRALNNGAVNISNDNGEFRANNLIDIDTNFSNYVIDGKLLSNKDIYIRTQAVVNNGEIKSLGDIKIIANDFDNGVSEAQIGTGLTRQELDKINQNSLISANGNLFITSNGDVNNYSTISAKKELKIESLGGDINNFEPAELIASSFVAGGNNDNYQAKSSKLTLIAKNGQINQYSQNSVVVDGDHEINANSYVNTGRIDISGSLTMNIVTDLINDVGALIYSGDNLILNIGNDLTNREGAVIYAEDDIFIRKLDPNDPNYNAADNRINKLDNLSGDIISYQGNINIDANEINNERREIYVQHLRRFRDDFCYPCNHEAHWDLNEIASYSGNITKESLIHAGGDININSSYGVNTLANTSLDNISSSIFAVNDININIGTLNNKSNSFKSYTKHFDYWWHGQGDWNTILNNLAPRNLKQENFPASIKAGNNININAVNNISNTEAVDNFSVVNPLRRNIDIASGEDFVNGIDIAQALDSGIVEKDISDIVSGSENQGLFTKSNNPNAPLFETRSQFVDQSKFFGSDYFYERLGLNLTDVQTEFEQQAKRLVGDQFFQHKLLVEQLRTIKKNALLLDDIDMDPDGEVKRLLDNAIEEYERLGLDPEDINQRLTQSQIDNLEKDIIWYETQEIDGGLYIVPKIYLSKATREAIKNGEQKLSKSTIYAGNDVNISSDQGGLRNQGSINAKNDVVINTQDRIVNDNFSEINAGNDLSLVSNGGDVINKSEIRAEGDIEIGAGGSFYNVATVTTNAKNLLDGQDQENQARGYNSEANSYVTNLADKTDSGNINSVVQEKGTISGSNITINAGNDFVNRGGDIEANNNLAIIAGDDVNIETVVDRDRSIRVWGGSDDHGKEIVDKSRNVGSEIRAGGDIVIESTGLGVDGEAGTVLSGSNINILGSKVSSQGDLDIIANDNVVIASVQDSYSLRQESHKDSSFGRSSSSSRSVDKVSNVKSELSSSVGDIFIKANGKDLNIIASDVKAEEGSVELIARNDINILSSQDYSEERTSSHKSGISTEKINQKIKSQTRQVSSDIVAGNGNVDIKSGRNTLIIASNVEADNDVNNNDVNKGNINITAGKFLDEALDQEVIDNAARVTIMAAKNVDYSYEYNSKIRKYDAKAIAVGMVAGSFTGGPLGAVSGAYIGSQAREGRIDMVENYDETIIGSNIRAGNGNININSAGDVTLVSSDISAGVDQNSQIINNLGNDKGKVNVMAGKLTDRDGNEIVTDEDAKINIGTMTENDYRKESHKKINIDYMGVAVGAALSGAAVGGSFGVVGMYYADSIIEAGLEVNEKWVLNESQESSLVNVASNLISQNKVNLASKGDLDIVASNIDSNNDINLSSENGEVNILSAINNSYKRDFNSRQGFDDVETNYNRGRASVDLNNQRYDEENVVSKGIVQSSNIVSEGDVNISSKNDVTLQALNLSSGNDVNIESREGDVNIISADNTTKTKQVIEDINVAVSVGVGNAFVDAGYAADDYVKSVEALKDAKDDLSRVKKLRNEGKATDEAVKDAETNLAMAILNHELAALKVSTAAARAAGTTKTAGFYGDVRLDTTSHKSETNSVLVTNTASVISANNDISVVSGSGLTREFAKENNVGNIYQLGSIVQSFGGDITYDSKNKIDIEASVDSFNSNSNSSTESMSVTLASTNPAGQLVDNLTAGLGYSKQGSESEVESLTYNNSRILAGNGSLTLNSGSDVNIISSNLLARDVDIEAKGNLKVESKQNYLKSRSKSEGFNLGVGSGMGSGSQTVSLGYNQSKSSRDRLWVDEQASIIGTNSVRVDVGTRLSDDVNDPGFNKFEENTGNLSLIGAKIVNVVGNINGNDVDGGNLVTNVNTLTYRDLYDYDEQRSTGYGVSLAGLNVGGMFGGGSKGDSKSNSGGKGNGFDANSKNPGQDSGFFPRGSLGVNVQDSGSRREQVTRATVGLGTINVANDNGSVGSSVEGLNRDVNRAQEITLDTVTGVLDVETQVDLRLLSKSGRKEIGKEVNFTGDLLSIPVSSISESISQSDDGGTNLIDSITNKYSLLHKMMFNPELLVEDLAEDSNNLARYDGDDLDPDLDASKSSGFYDRDNDVIVINVDKNDSDSELAGTLAHENYHAQRAKSGYLYDQAEENTAHNIGDFVESRWGSYQGNNSSFGGSLYDVGVVSNNYLEGVEFGDRHNPLVPLAIPVASALITSILVYEGDGDAFKGGERINDDVSNLVSPLVRNIVLGADVVANEVGLVEDGEMVVSDYLLKVSEDYEKLLGYVPDESRQAFGVLGLTLGVSGVGSVSGGLVGKVDDLWGGTSSFSQRDKLLSNIENSAKAREASNFSEHIKREGNIQEDLGIWPPNEGFTGKINKNDTLMPGYQFDRYGNKMGTFVAPKDTTFSQRSLPSHMINGKTNEYEVIKPITNVKTGKTSPWFGQSGGGTQHKLPDSVGNLVRDKYLKKINK